MHVLYNILPYDDGYILIEWNTLYLYESVIYM